MSPDRAEIAGTGAALAFHAALIAALSLSLAHVAKVPEPPAMEVELVDEVGLQAAAPAALAVPPPPSTAPEIADANPVEPTSAPTAAPLPPAAKVVPTPAPHAIERATARPTRALPTPARTAPKASRIGADFLKGIAADSPAKANAPARPAATTYGAQAKINIGQAIIQQAKRCADRQPYVGEGANRVRLTVNLRFNRDGRLLRSPVILGRSGDPDLTAKYGDLLEDQVRRIFADCAPFRLPPELYDTANGGWKDFTFNYRVD